MTTPSKIWILSLSPSLIFVCTRTVSPTRNSGTWPRTSGVTFRCSTSSIAFERIFVPSVITGRPKTILRQAFCRVSRSGRRSRVRATASSRRHCAIFAWSPERSTSGTRRPRKSGGRVYCGPSRSPSREKLSACAESSLPSTPGTRRATASITASAANSPPVRMKSPSEISSSTQRSTRSSTPSYRPQTTISAPRPASSSASSWSNRLPCGERRTTRAVGSRRRAASIAATRGSGFITIPAPPPYGTSSVTRCLPSAKSRMSVTRTPNRPFSRAFARLLSPSGHPAQSDQVALRDPVRPVHLELPLSQPDAPRVAKPFRIGVVRRNQHAPAETVRPRDPPDREAVLHGDLPAGRLRRRLAGQLDQLGDGRARLGTHLQPMLEAIGLEVDARGSVVRIVSADLLVEAAVARVPRVRRNDVIEGQFLRAPTGEAQLDGHGRSSLKKRGSLHGADRRRQAYRHPYGDTM